jgi:hypothetical protein
VPEYTEFPHAAPAPFHFECSQLALKLRAVLSHCTNNYRTRVMHFSKIVTIHHRKRLHSVPLMSLAPHRSVRLPRRVVIAGRFVITSCRKLKLRLKGSLQRHTSIPDLIEIRRAVGLNCAERDGHGRRSVALVWRASRKHGVTIRRDGLLMQNGDAAAVTVNLRASESRQFFVTVCSTYRLRKTDV